MENKMKLLRCSTLIFIIFTFIGCSEEKEDKQIKEVKTSIILNKKDIEILNDKFVELKSILKSNNSKNCHSDQLEKFFKSISTKFNKNNFSIKLKDNNSKISIDHIKPNCQKSETLG